MRDAVYPTLCYVNISAVQGRPNAISVIAMAERGSMFDPGPCL
jgi:fructose-1,6-bisphosphatase/sedoheptulose 1,7-bisphosphatase-like protein